jgi:hypothetical protein
MLTILSDGAWHLQRVVLQEMAKTVDPGKAVRTVEAQRRRLSNNQPRVRHRSLEDREASGQMFHARDTMRSWVRMGRIQVRGEGAATEVRLTPKDGGDSLSVPELAMRLRRADTTINKWARSPAALAEITALLPSELAGRTPVLTTNSAGYTRIPRAAVIAWERYSDTRRKVGGLEVDNLTSAVATVFGLDMAAAHEKVAALRDYLTEQHGPVEPPPPEPASEPIRTSLARLAEEAEHVADAQEDAPVR